MYLVLYALDAQISLLYNCCFTYLALGSCPVSVFKEGKLAGGRLAEGTFPRLCIPCLRLS